MAEIPKHLAEQFQNDFVNTTIDLLESPTIRKDMIARERTELFLFAKKQPYDKEEIDGSIDVFKRLAQTRKRIK